MSDALISLIPTYGPWIIFGIIALENAGAPLPGETILVAPALVAATTGQISIVVVVLASAGGAIVGDGIGYMVGRRFGLPLIRRYGRYIRLDENRLLIGRYLFFRYGNVVVFFGRFVAVLRMFAALLAGANSMPAGRFFFFNITGGVCWACLFGFGAYAAGAGFSIAFRTSRIEATALKEITASYAQEAVQQPVLLCCTGGGVKLIADRTAIWSNS